MTYDPTQESVEEYLRRVSLKDKINEEWKRYDQEEKEEGLIMPGIEIKGQSKIATYRHGGRIDYNEGGRVGLKAGGNGKWIQKVNKSIKARGTKGKCTPITKPGCTGRAKALALTFKKMAKKRKAA